MLGALGFGELKTGRLWVCVATEFLSVALFVICGVGSCINNASILQISFGFAVAAGVLIWGIAHVSGGHLNPAVTIGFAVTRKMSVVKSLLYIISQCLGATLGAVILRYFVPSDENQPNNLALNPLPTLGAPQPRDDVSSFQIVCIESIITFILVFTVFAACDGRRKGFDGGVGPLMIGLSIFIGHIWAIPLTGAATNPAAAFGTALVSGRWNVHWAYWIGPMNGGIQASLIYDLVLAMNAGTAKLKSFFTDGAYNDSDFDEKGKRVVFVSDKNNNKRERSILQTQSRADQHLGYLLHGAGLLLVTTIATLTVCLLVAFLRCVIKRKLERRKGWSKAGEYERVKSVSSMVDYVGSQQDEAFIEGGDQIEDITVI